MEIQREIHDAQSEVDQLIIDVLAVLIDLIDKLRSQLMIFLHVGNQEFITIHAIFLREYVHDV